MILMNIKIDFTPELTNTRFAPLAVLSALYQHQNTLQPLQQVHIPMRERYFRSADKLTQILLSILAGCKTLSEVNPILQQEKCLATVWGWEHFADQSSLSRTLDELTLKNIDELRSSNAQIWKPNSQVIARDWRKYLWLDYDLSALPCGPKAEEAMKGYFADKKTPTDANWPVSAPFMNEKRYGPMCFQATVIPYTACSHPLKQPKLL
jgi:hypothetical protein